MKEGVLFRGKWVTKAYRDGVLRNEAREKTKAARIARQKKIGELASSLRSHWFSANRSSRDRALAQLRSLDPDPHVHLPIRRAARGATVTHAHGPHELRLVRVRERRLRGVGKLRQYGEGVAGAVVGSLSLVPGERAVALYMVSCMIHRKRTVNGCGGRRGDMTMQRIVMGKQAA
jgi:hypothetical protein